MRTRTAAPLVGIAALALSAGAAQATVVTFSQITSNGSVDVSAQLILDITDLGGGIISFDLSNVGPLSSVITMFNLQDNSALFADMTAVISGAGVDFEEQAPPGNLPAGNTVNFISAWGSKATPPPAHNGVNEGEEVELRLLLNGGKSFADVSAAIASGALRAGLHVQSIDQPGGGDQSETYVSNPQLPTPGTLAIAALGGMVATRRRR